MSAHRHRHPAVQTILDGDDAPPIATGLNDWMTTSPSLARALAVGCLSRLDPHLGSVNVWDPAAGSGFAGALLANALASSGADVHYRGQDINERAVQATQSRFAATVDAEAALADTLATNPFPGFAADLVIVDAPWGMDWRSSVRAVQSRRQAGEFRFGLPQQSDSTWLFITLALEKLRPPAAGGGRVAALVNPRALNVGGNSAGVRRAIVEAGLLESVTRLPEGLAPNTSIPLYLLTFTNGLQYERGKAMVADLQAQFTTDGGRRSMPLNAFRDLEYGLRTGKSGPRNRTVEVRQFTRRDATLVRTSTDGRQLSWRLTTYNDSPVDAQLLESRYGPGSGVDVDGMPRETVDLDPSRIFGDDSRELLKDLDAKGWPSRRLSSLLRAEPKALSDTAESESGELFIPTTRGGRASTEPFNTESDGRVLSIKLDGELIHPTFLAAWLNSEKGISSRRRAIEASSTGSSLRALRSGASSLMRWADELIVPVPARRTQLSIASADERLGSFQAELNTRRATIWVSPESADAVVSRIASAFDDSSSTWLEELPYPIATALWTAETASSLGDKQAAYIHAWEAIVTFHATVLLSASRSAPGGAPEVEVAIRQALHEHHIGIERATLGTWVLLVEKTSSVFRRALATDDADELARVRRAFGDLGRAGIERLVSKDVVNKFNELNNKRNRWLGHTGYTSDDERHAHIGSLTSDLRDLRQLLGDVWAQLVLVRAGSVDRDRDGYLQSTEIALGSNSPFRRRSFRVGDPMVSGDLYLTTDGSQSPLHLLQFVQLRSNPRDAQYACYFYNRVEGTSVRLISYQHGPESEVHDDAESLREDFGELTLWQ